MEFKDFLTVITITKNNDNDLINTLNSIKDQSFPPDLTIVQDGKYRKKPNFIKKFLFEIHYSSDNDLGIYDAMNKALSKVKTTYILFLNSGDKLQNKDSLKNVKYEINKYLNENKVSPDIIFFKWQITNNKKILSPKLSPLKFNHQAVVYKTELHKKFGFYISEREFLTADYFFFRYLTLSKKVSIKISNKILALIDPDGKSKSLKTFLSVACIDYLLGLKSRSLLILIAIFHPPYNLLKKIIKNLFKL